MDWKTSLAAMTPEQLAQMLSHVLGEQQASLASVLSSHQASMLAAVEKIVGHGGGGEAKMNDKILAKHFRIDSFSGDKSKWEDWNFAFKRNVRSMSREAYDAMKKWEESTDDIDEKLELDENMGKRSAELYDVLCQTCTGEALMVVKAVEDMEGIRAWQTLFKKYNPRTMARGVRMLSEAIGPPKVKDLNEFETAVTRWEDKVKRLSVQFSEKLSEAMKIAIFTNMMPGNLQDYIYIHAEKDCKYEDVREKVGALVSNKITANTGPTPMDIGDVGGQGEVWWQEEEEDAWDDEHNVGVIAGHYQCRNCSGYGHFARECPSKGKGKGPKGGDKGKGKGAPKGKGAKGEGWSSKGKGGGKADYSYANQYYYTKGKGAYESKGKGKGYQGECWNCGKVGHKANECTAMNTNYIEEGSGEEAVEIEGMWDVSGVQAVELQGSRVDPSGDWARRWSTTALVGGPGSRAIMCLRNRFAALSEDEDEAEAEMGEKDHVEQGEHARREEQWRPVWRRRRAQQERKHVEVAEVHVEEVAAEEVFTRLSSMTFNVAGVCKPLVSAAKVIEAGNRVVMDPKGSYIENTKTGERMQLRVKKGVFVFDVEYQDGDRGEITLDSGAGVSVWPKGLKKHLLHVGPKKEGLKMVAANGTAIENIGQTKVIFRGVASGASSFSGQPRSVEVAAA